jgi:hypothetical protein
MVTLQMCRERCGQEVLQDIEHLLGPLLPHRSVFGSSLEGSIILR